MQKTVNWFYQGFGKTKTALTCLAGLLYLFMVQFSGGSIPEFLLFAILFVFYILLPGFWAESILRKKLSLPGFRFPLAFLFGSGFFAVLYCFTMRLGLLVLLRILPPVFGILGLLALLRPWKGKPVVPKLKHSLPSHQWMLVLLFAALLILYTFAGVVKNGRPSAVGDVLINQDLLWNVGNANSFKLAFPPQDIRFYDVRLHYHYLTELLAGALSIVSGISAYNIIGFYMQPFMLAIMVASLYALGGVLWPGKRFSQLLFTYSHFLFGCASLWKILPNGWSVFWNSYTTHLITNINSQTTAILYLSIFTGLFVHSARQKYQSSFVYFATMLCAYILLCFSKGPIAAIVTISMVLTLLIGIFQKKSHWKGIAFAFIAAAIFIFIYITMFSSGANESMPFSWYGTLEKGYFQNILKRISSENHTLGLVAIPVLYLLQSFLMAPAQFPLYLGSLWHTLRRFKQAPAEHLLAHGTVAGGLLAYFLFNHPAMSQTYFLFAAIFFLNYLSVDTLPLFLGWCGQNKGKLATRFAVGFLAFFTAVGVATTGFLYINLGGSGLRQFARNAGIVPKYPYDAVVTPEDELAMLWLRDNSPVSAMFATNRIHTGGRKEGISNLYSAFNERQGYMEGFQYAVTNMGVSEEIVNHRIQVNTALFSGDTPPETVLQLCRENNISYLIYSSQFDGEYRQMELLDLVYNSDPVKVFYVPEE